MNNPYIFGSEAELVVRALDGLQASIGIQGKLIDNPESGADATIMLFINGQALQYDCQIKKKIDRYALPLELLNRLGNVQHTLFVSSPLSLEMANHCRELGLQFIDTAGNAYINNGTGIYIYMAGRRGDDQFQTSTNNTMTPAVLRMMFAFLADPTLLNAPYRDISYRMRVSTGVIGKSFETLEARGLIGNVRGKRMIRTPELFLNEWAGGYAGRLKPKLKKYRFATDDLDKFFNNWHPEFRLSAWGGERAAQIWTGYLRPEEGTLYVDMEESNTLRDIVKDFRLRADSQGRIEIVDMFWNSDSFTDWFPAVPPHLVYADLMATHDSRNIAVAKQIAAEVIEYVHHKT